MHKNAGTVAESMSITRDLCPAYGKTCNKCHKPNHKCHSTVNRPSVRTIDDNDGEEVFPTEIATVHIDDSQFITLKGNFMRFQVDTGAQYNVIPLALYKQATEDIHLHNVRPVQSQITAYGGTTLPVVGLIAIKVATDTTLNANWLTTRIFGHCWDEEPV